MYVFGQWEEAEEAQREPTHTRGEHANHTERPQVGIEAGTLSL